MTENPSDRPSSDLDRVPAEQRWRLHRVLPHPSSRIYQALMDPELLPHWYGPQGWSVHPESLELDPRPGGIRRFAMVMDDDPQMGAPSTAGTRRSCRRRCSRSRRRCRGPMASPPSI